MRLWPKNYSGTIVCDKALITVYKGRAKSLKSGYTVDVEKQINRVEIRKH